MTDKTEILIQFVRSFPYLYDTRHEDYKNIVKKAEKWKEIGEALNNSSEAVKQKWKNLRDCYIKYLKYLRGSTGSVKKYQNWPWVDHLEFLKDTLVPRSTASNVSHSGDEVHKQCEGDSVLDMFSFEMPPPTPKRQSVKTSKRKKVPGDMAAVLKCQENKKDKNNLDHVDQLFLTYAHTFKQFSPRTQAVLKMELAQLFGQAELREVAL